MTDPVVSVVLAVHDNVAELPAALEGVLAQDFAAFELLVVDDGSTDGSGVVADAYAARDARVRVIHQANAGLGPALNVGCAAARGSFLARHDADDVSAPSRLRRQVAYLERHRDVVLCGTWAWFVDPTDGPEFSLEVPDRHDVLLSLLRRGSNPFTHGSVMMRREAFAAEPGGYRFRSLVEDVDLWLRLVRHGRLGMCESVEYFYRLSPHGINFRNLGRQRRLYDVVLQLDREREAGGERMDWRAAEAGAAVAGGEDGIASAQYALGVHRLARGDHGGYRAAMTAAAAGEGRLARKAARHLRLSRLVPMWLVGLAYRRALRRGAMRYSRPLPAGTALPACARALVPRWRGA